MNAQTCIRIGATLTLLTALLGAQSAARAQSTTGGRSGGSTASTGTGYLTEGKRNTASNPNSMTIADEGASRAYMYVPPSAAKNRSASPDGSSSANAAKTAGKPPKSPAKGSAKKP